MSYKSFLSGFVMLSLLVLGSFAKGTKPTGELALASGATINNVAALAGTTLFSNNRIKTANNGGAIISLGKAGRIELGAATDLTLQLSQGIIGGTLSGGRVIIIAPSGVQINLTTPDGSVVSVPNQPSRFIVDSGSGKTNVVAKTGAAKVAAGGRISVIGLVGASGEVQGLVKNSAPNGNNRIAGNGTTTNPTMSLLLRATAGQSLDAFLTNRATNAPGGFFFPSLTCKDFIENPRCIRRSPTR